MKSLFLMAMRNITRNKRRSFLSALAIFLAVFMIVFFYAFTNGMFGSMKKNVKMSDTGDIKISQKEYIKKETVSPLLYSITDYEKIIQETEAIQGVKVATPRIKFPVLLSKDDKNFSLFGMAIDPQKEKVFNPLYKQIQEGSYLSADKKEILIGEGVAKQLEVKVGDSLTLLVKTKYESIGIKSFKIVGIFNYGMPTLDNHYFFVNLKYGQKLLRMKKQVTEILVMTEKGKIKEIANQIDNKILQKYSSDYTAQTWFKQKNYFTMINLATVVYTYVYLIFVLLASLVIINTMLMVIYERYKEIGVMRAMGLQKKEVLITFLMESGVLSFFGSLAGVLAGAILLLALSNTGINLMAMAGKTMESFSVDTIIYLNLSVKNLIFSFLLGFLLPISFVYIPLRKIFKINIVDSLRHL